MWVWSVLELTFNILVHLSTPVGHTYLNRWVTGGVIACQIGGWCPRLFCVFDTIMSVNWILCSTKSCGIEWRLEKEYSTIRAKELEEQVELRVS